MTTGCACGGSYGYTGDCNGCGTYNSDFDQAAADEQLLAGIRNGTWLSEQEFPPLRWAVPALIPEGLTFLAGAPKVGKSWFIVDVLLAVAGGGRALGAIPVGAPPRKVLYCALEDGDRRMQSRCQAIWGWGPLPETYHYITQVPRDAIVGVIEAWMRRNPETAMIVLDTLGRVMPRAEQGETSYERDYRIGEKLKAIADRHPGLALEVVHHTRKTIGTDFIDEMSGTQGLAGSADAVMVLRRSRGESDGSLHVTGRDISEDEYALRMAQGRFWMLDGTTLAEAADRARARKDMLPRLSDRTMEILEYVTQHPDGVTAKQVTDKFGPDAAEYLRRHVEAGRLIKPRRGFYRVPPN